jgi:hypothetical protein
MRLYYFFIAVLLAGSYAGASDSCATPADPPPTPCLSQKSSPPDSSTPQTATNQPQEVSIKKVILNIPGDQIAIWTSPARIRTKDTYWLFPLAGTTAALLATDRNNMVRARSNPKAVNLSENASNAGLFALAAYPAFLYGLGHLNGSSHMRETGLLSAEALGDSWIANEALKFVFSRERPTLTDGHGHFFQQLGNSSFPSGHSMLSWTAASVIAHEYPDVITQTLAYGTATMVSVARVTARKHFPSDVVVGGALGWLIGRQIYRAHHDQDLDGADYGNFSADNEFDPARLGSTFVPLDSWIYPALKRLAALGYIQTQFTALEPWTRRECMRQLEEAEYFAQDLPPESEINQMIERIKSEFQHDGEHYRSVQLDSIYTRYGHISGEPLRDSYHFGQTIWNDFGRPYDEGNKMFTGASASAVAGRFFLHSRPHSRRSLTRWISIQCRRPRLYQKPIASIPWICMPVCNWATMP